MNKWFDSQVHEIILSQYNSVDVHNIYIINIWKICYYLSISWQILTESSKKQENMEIPWKPGFWTRQMENKKA